MISVPESEDNERLLVLGHGTVSGTDACHSRNNGHRHSCRQRRHPISRRSVLHCRVGRSFCWISRPHGQRTSLLSLPVRSSSGRPPGRHKHRRILRDKDARRNAHRKASTLHRLGRSSIRSRNRFPDIFVCWNFCRRNTTDWDPFGRMGDKDLHGKSPGKYAGMTWA